MSAEITLINPEDISLFSTQRDFPHEDPELEFIHDVTHNPGLRLRLSDLLRTIHIPEYQLLDLGYTTHPVVQDKELIEHLNLGHLDKDRQKAVATTVLGACLEVRNDISSLLDNKHKPSPAGYMAAVPFPLRFIAVAKACAGDPGSVADPSELAQGDKKREVIGDYVTEKLGVSNTKASLLLDTIAIIHGAKILRNHLSYGMESESWRVLANYPSKIIGVPAPREGYFLPDNIEVAIRKAHYEWSTLDYWNASWRSEADRQEQESFKEGLEWLCTRVAQLAGKPEDEQAYWRAYTITSVLAHSAFAGRTVEGFHGTYDQFAIWEEPMADSAYYPSFTHFMERLQKAQTALGAFDEGGTMLAVRGTATRIGRGVERDVIEGDNQSRAGRLRTLGEMYRLLQRHDPDAADQFIATVPLIGTHVQEKADRWQARFS